MFPYSVLVTGANRGIGLALVKEFLKRKDIQVVIATARDPVKADSLKEISDARLRLVQMDLNNDESIKNSYSEVDKIVGSHGLNVLLNNAGVLIKYSTSGEVDRNKLVEQFQTNVFGVVIATQTYLPLLRKAASLKSDDSFSIDRAAILQISSGYGSITNNDRGSAGIGAAAYKASKTALNQFSRTFSIDLKPDHILVASFCPGWIQTRMGGRGATITAEETAECLVNSFYKLNQENNGNFYNRNLNPIPF